MRNRPFVLGLLGIVLLAAGLRAHRLGDWPFAGDELGTLWEVDVWRSTSSSENDSPDANIPALIPVSMLVHSLAEHAFGRDELGARIVPAGLGVLLVLCAGLFLRPGLGPWAALFTALLLAVSPEHLFFSQFHRFYNLSAFVALLTLALGAQAVQRRSVVLCALACVLAIVALLTHTLMVVLLLGLMAGTLAGLWFSEDGLRWGLPMCIGVALLATAGLFLFHLIPLGSGKTGLTSDWQPYGLAHAVGAAIHQVGWPVLLLALVGAPLFWKSRPSMAAFWTVQALAWASMIVLLPLVIPYHPEYVFPMFIAVFVFAGAGAGRIAEHLFESGKLPIAAWVVLVACLPLPKLIGYYQDGNRFDYRTVARGIAEQWRSGDRLTTPSPELVRHYAPSLDSAIPLSLSNPLSTFREHAQGEHRLWIIVQYGRSGLKPEVREWLDRHCERRVMVRRRRFDYYEFVLEAHLWEPPK